MYKAGRGFIDSTRKGNYTENIKIVTETPDVVIVERRKYDEGNNLVKPSRSRCKKYRAVCLNWGSFMVLRCQFCFVF